MPEVKYFRTDMTQQHWREQAQCQYVDPVIFFPVSKQSKAYEQAIAICQRCPVRSECLQHAMDDHETCGVWGGQLFQRNGEHHERN